jgi:hypothetical protein
VGGMTGAVCGVVGWETQHFTFTVRCWRSADVIVGGVRPDLVGSTNSDRWLYALQLGWLAAGRKQGVWGQLRVVGWDDRVGVWCGGLGNPTLHLHRPLLALS